MDGTPFPNRIPIKHPSAMIRIALCFILIPSLLGLSFQGDLTWPTGKWRTVSMKDNFSEEIWTLGLDGNLVGLGCFVKKGDTLFQETMTILLEEENWFFRAEPQGQASTLFALDEHSATHWVFINPDHDYPQRIEYRLIDKEHLKATVSLLNGKRSNTWDYVKQP
jgi:hypothetical protein